MWGAQLSAGLFRAQGPRGLTVCSGNWKLLRATLCGVRRAELLPRDRPFPSASELLVVKERVARGSS